MQQQAEGSFPRLRSPSSHFIGGDLEAQRGTVTCSKLYIVKGKVGDFVNQVFIVIIIIMFNVIHDHFNSQNRVKWVQRSTERARRGTGA